jgi:hypothetical protein
MDLPQQQTIVQYVTNVSQTMYTFAFYAPLNTDIQVYYQAQNAPPIPATDLLVLNVNYTVVFNPNPSTGGYIQLLFTPVSGYILTINRNVAASLNTNFSQAINFSGANLDAALDRLLLLCQQNQNYALERNLSYIINAYLPNETAYTQLPPLANMQIWQGTGAGIAAVTLVENDNFSTLRSQLSNSAPFTNGATIIGYYNNLTSTPTTVDATLTTLINDINAIQLEAFTVINVQTLTGTGTYVPSIGALYTWAKGVGAGGAGGGCQSGAASIGMGAGGSGGAYGEAIFPSQSLPYSCGVGGVGVAGAGGGAGTATTLGSFLNLNGGSGGAALNSFGFGGYTYLSGYYGGTVVTAGLNGVQGGSSGSANYAASAGALISGMGGDSALGRGGYSVFAMANGNPGVGFGSGGSGALTIGAFVRTGGNGAPGELIMIEFGIAP